MVGRRFLVPSIGVRVPVRQQIQNARAFARAFCIHYGEKGTRKAEANSLGDCLTRRGREHLVDLERSEQVYLVIRDRVPVRQQR